MEHPTPSLLSSKGAEAATVLPPLQWGWLALVAGVHAAGLAWLGLGDAPASAARAPEPVLSIALLAAPAETAKTVEPSPRVPPPAPPVEPRPRPQAKRAAPSRPAPQPVSVPAPVAPEPAAHGVAEPAPSPPAAEVSPVPESRAAPVAAAAPTAPTDTEVAARYDAAYLHNPPPAYPPAARRRGEDGQVMLRVHVLASGRADRIEIAESSGHPRLDRAAREAVGGWRFEPARRGEEPIDSWLRVPIVFRLEGR